MGPPSHCAVPLGETGKGANEILLNYFAAKRGKVKELGLPPFLGGRKAFPMTMRSTSQVPCSSRRDIERSRKHRLSCLQRDREQLSARESLPPSSRICSARVGYILALIPGTKSGLGVTHETGLKAPMFRLQAVVCTRRKTNIVCARREKSLYFWPEIPSNRQSRFSTGAAKDFQVIH